MEQMPIPGGEAEGRELMELISRYDAPAYVRRARGVEEALEMLLERASRQRTEWLAVVRGLVGELAALAGEWEALRPWLDDDQVAALQALHAELAPKLKVPVERTSSRLLRRKLRGLNESIAFFNRRWQRYLGELDLRTVNDLREGYNRYYLLEKECAIRSPALARQGFKPLAPLTLAEVEAAVPPLPVLRLKA